ncbi:hypothetical protein ACVW00_001822 [Marmoricola sp. URHA0025 HA25]
MSVEARCRVFAISIAEARLSPSVATLSGGHCGGCRTRRSGPGGEPVRRRRVCDVVRDLRGWRCSCAGREWFHVRGVRLDVNGSSLSRLQATRPVQPADGERPIVSGVQLQGLWAVDRKVALARKAQPRAERRAESIDAPPVPSPWPRARGLRQGPGPEDHLGRRPSRGGSEWRRLRSRRRRLRAVESAPHAWWTAWRRVPGPVLQSHVARVQADECAHGEQARPARRQTFPR